MDYTEILPGQLWLGSIPSRDDLATLKEKLGPEPVVIDLNRNPQEQEACRKLGLMYDERTPQIEDTGEPIPISKLLLVSRIVDEHVQGGRQVYLHCTAGRGRSPTCAAAYLIHTGASVFEAKKVISDKRPVWIGKDADYAGLLEDFAKMQDLSKSSEF